MMHKIAQKCYEKITHLPGIFFLPPSISRQKSMFHHLVASRNPRCGKLNETRIFAFRHFLNARKHPKSRTRIQKIDTQTGQPTQ
jgi:hypothetical protein